MHFTESIVYLEHGRKKVTFFKKFNERGLIITFTQQEEADEPLLEIPQLQENCKPLIDPIVLQRGNISYPTYVFDVILLNMIY